MAGPGNILIRVGAETADAIRGLAGVDTALGSTMTTSEKMSAGIKKAAIPAAAALAAVGYAAIDAGKAAAEDASEKEKLIGVIERATGASKDQAAAMDDWIGKVELATGVTDTQLRSAYEKLVVATGDTAKAQDLLNQSLDISAQSGKDIETVAGAVAKGYEGQTMMLSRLIPGLDEGARKSKDFTVIMGELAQVTGGAAAEAANTASGQMARFNVATQEAKESIGAALIPVIEALLPLLISVANFANQNAKAVDALAAVIAVLAAGILAANVAIKAYEALQIAIKVATVAWTAAQWLLNAALTANPIGVVVVALGALVAAIVLAYTKSETFRNIVDAAFAAIKSAITAVEAAFRSLLSAASAAFDWIVAHWQLSLFAFGPIGAAVYVIVTNFDKLKDAADAAAGAAVGALNAIKGAIDAVINAVESLISALGRIHVPHISLPDINPFSAPAAVFQSGLGRGAGGRVGAIAPSSSPITVNVFGAIDPEGTARAILRTLSAHNRRLGLAP